MLVYLCSVSVQKYPTKDKSRLPTMVAAFSWVGGVWGGGGGGGGGVNDPPRLNKTLTWNTDR